MAATSFDRLVEEMQRPPFHNWLMPIARGVDDERREVVVALPFRPDLSLSPDQPIFHGGVLAALIDIVGHAAAAVWHGAPSPTIALQIDFLRPAIATELLAKAILRQLGRTVSRVDVEIGDGNKAFVLGRGTFLTRGSET